MRTLLSRLALILGGILVALLLLEVGFRISGFRATPNTGLHTQGWAKPDALLGWRCSPGVWPVDCEQRPMTILPDATRAVTGGNSVQAGRTVLLVGDSYAAGYGVTDAQSMASRMQAYLPGARVINAATPGYGTYQSYLAMKQHLQDHPQDLPAAVVYGYAAHQPIRNVADWNWISSLQSYSRKQLVPPHLARQADNTWKEVPPKEYNLLRLAEHSDVLFFVQSLILKKRFGVVPESEQMAATNQCLRLMKDLCDAKGIPLFVVNIFNNRQAKNDAVRDFCAAQTIHYLQPKLDVPWLTPEYFLCGGKTFGHPNERYHEEMGKEIAALLKPYLAGKDGAQPPAR